MLWKQKKTKIKTRWIQIFSRHENFHFYLKNWVKLSRHPVLFYGSVCCWCSISSCSVGQAVLSVLTREGVLVLFVCAVVREGSGLLPGRHSWRTSSGGKWVQVHFLKCVLISSAWEAGNFTPGVSAQPLSLYKVKPLLVSLMFGTPCT